MVNWALVLRAAADEIERQAGGEEPERLENGEYSFQIAGRNAALIEVSGGRIVGAPDWLDFLVHETASGERGAVLCAEHGLRLQRITPIKPPQ